MPDRAAPVRVLLLSAVGTRVNPYLGLLQAGLASAGADVRLADCLSATELGPDHRPDVIHLHWLERYDLPPEISAPPPGAAARGASLLHRTRRRVVERVGNLPAVYQVRRWRRLQRLFAQLRAFQADGGQIAYTVHNLGSHEEEGLADRWGMGQLAKLANVLHVHDASTAESVAGRFGRRDGVVVIPHGHYLDSYPNMVSRLEARRALELPFDAFVYVTLGLWRPYKGLGELVPAFRSLSQPDAILLLAGEPRPPAYAATLAELAGDDSRIRMVPGFVPPDEVQLYLNAADICVLPYRQITTSGAALLAFSFGLPVIAPAIAAFPDLIADLRGICYDPNEPAGLVRALAQARNRDWRGTREEILAWVAQFDWQEIGRRLLAAYASSNKPLTGNS